MAYLGEGGVQWEESGKLRKSYFKKEKKKTPLIESRSPRKLVLGFFPEVLIFKTNLKEVFLNPLVRSRNCKSTKVFRPSSLP